MDECLYRIEFEYDIEKHIKIVSRMNKWIKIFSFILLALSILLIVDIILRHENHMATSFILLFVLLISPYVLLVSISKKQLRKRFSAIYESSKIVFIYEFYDEYIKIQRIGEEIEIESKMKYSTLVNAFVVEDNIGYATAKDQGLLFICCDKTKEIVDFVKSKITTTTVK